jgi:hypothetical protein
MDLKAATQMVINCMAQVLSSLSCLRCSFSNVHMGGMGMVLQTLSDDTAAIKDGEEKLSKLGEAPGFGEQNYLIDPSPEAIH